MNSFKYITVLMFSVLFDINVYSMNALFPYRILDMEYSEVYVTRDKVNDNDRLWLQKVLSSYKFKRTNNQETLDGLLFKIHDKYQLKNLRQAVDFINEYYPEKAEYTKLNFFDMSSYEAEKEFIHKLKDFCNQIVNDILQTYYSSEKKYASDNKYNSLVENPIRGSDKKIEQILTQVKEMDGNVFDYIYGIEYETPDKISSDYIDALLQCCQFIPEEKWVAETVLFFMLIDFKIACLKLMDHVMLYGAKPSDMLHSLTIQSLTFAEYVLSILDWAHGKKNEFGNLVRNNLHREFVETAPPDNSWKKLCQILRSNLYVISNKRYLLEKDKNYMYKNLHFDISKSYSDFKEKFLSQLEKKYAAHDNLNASIINFKKWLDEQEKNSSHDKKENVKMTLDDSEIDYQATPPKSGKDGSGSGAREMPDTPMKEVKKRKLF